MNQEQYIANHGSRYTPKPDDVKIVQAMTWGTGIFGLGDDQRVYRWDSESTYWELFNEVLNRDL